MTSQTCFLFQMRSMTAFVLFLSILLECVQKQAPNWQTIGHEKAASSDTRAISRASGSRFFLITIAILNIVAVLPRQEHQGHLPNGQFHCQGL